MTPVEATSGGEDRQNALCRALSPLMARAYAAIRRLRAPVFPRTVFIETTSRCNLRCPICPRDRMKREAGDMTMDLFETIADELAVHDERGELRMVGLHFFGDPLMHPRIIEMINLIGGRLPNLRRRGLHRDPLQGLCTSTNALLLTEDLVEPLLSSSLTWLGVAVDAATETTYAQVHGADRFDLLVSKVQRLLEANAASDRDLPTIGLQFVETPGTEDEVEAFVEMWRPYVEASENVRAVIKPFTTWAGQIGGAPGPGWYFSTPCSYPWEMLVVVSDGRVAPCCYDMDCTMELGRVPDQTLEEIWHGERLRGLREKLLRVDFSGLQLCRSCDKSRTYLSRLLPFLRR
ncbi:MAG: radical SAM/SPASM domain-containing protein [Armatimonadota bacterium]